MPTLVRKDMRRLWDHCQKFVAKHEISCPDAVAQDDAVILNAYAFIEGVCDIVGYFEHPEDV